jgi:hypothetical protein
MVATYLLPLVRELGLEITVATYFYKLANLVALEAQQVR